MAEAMTPLTLHEDAFAQDLFGWPDGVRRLKAMRILCVRHLEDSVNTRAAFHDLGLPWPERTNELQVVGTMLVARRQPEEVLLASDDEAALGALAQALASAGDAFSVDLSHGMTVLELQRQGLDARLVRLVGQDAMPRLGRASRCRLVDVPVMLWRPDEDRILLLADRSLSPYLSQWLAYAQEGQAAEAATS
ncbi:hypothetical protein [Roseateles sp.]|uniref:hypothetical protein n=1 Tax=Roseateles sp. TaxID=1971397 RepID=UPI0039EA0CF0